MFDESNQIMTILVLIMCVYSWMSLIGIVASFIYHAISSRELESDEVMYD